VKKERKKERKREKKERRKEKFEVTDIFAIFRHKTHVKCKH